MSDGTVTRVTERRGQNEKYPAIGIARSGMISVVGTFEQLARAAFDDVATRHDLAFDTASESTWWADVRWVGESSSLRVSDDRRDRFVQVSVERDLRAGDVEDLSLAVARDRLAIPLWAICEAAGGNQRDVLVAGDEAHRHQGLPKLAEATERYAARFLDGDWSAVMGAYEVVARAEWETSDEGRKARRHLP